MADWAERYFEAWARHAQASDPINGKADRERMLAFMDPTIVYEDIPMGLVFHGHDGVLKMGAQALQMANDLRFKLISAQASGDSFALETETYGTNTGAVGPMAATGRTFMLRGVSIGRRGPDGKVTVHKDYWDLAFYLRQMGLLPGGGDV